ncbi:endo alpha-1,4 polygalactosaminidase [Zeaxanthinibacter enoshimensis]|uniref:Endo-alpha-1,4-polygalactosaminidase (GH114 family) n=1 Tax=Zeaxanthinibacter enoshimensis TaxID=392009 RepID=A0A4R6TUG8_9FLAO|nr:endo alpha-1,4 polygalactosaminidase [Zeaxanthinibacter enoshimensis]TDQ32578.1 endo-alpha-1,4-polygalactosaminidase (GH114 family) [Zeaxanthinibacter enoshimensis]
MRLIKILYLCTTSVALTQQDDPQVSPREELYVCYGKIPVEQISGYKLVVVEAAHYSGTEVKALKQQNEKVIAYISLTEVNRHAPFFNEMTPYLLGKNPNWNSYYLDIASSGVRHAIISLALTYKAKEFDGLLLDTLDNAGPWGPLNHLEEALHSLVRELAEQWSSPYLIQNGGLFQKTLPTEGILLESVVSSYDFKTKIYTIRPAAEQEKLLNSLEKIEKDVFLLEYADTQLKRSEISETLKKRKIPYSIANIELQGVPVFKENPKQ